MAAQRDGVSGSALPRELCYVVNVTGDRLTKNPPDSSGCGPALGLGLVSPEAYAVGSTASFDVPAGVARHFEIIGFKSPLGLQDGLAVCGTFSVDFAGPASSNFPGVQFRVAERVVSSGPVLFYTADADINPGTNNVALNAVPLVVAPLTAAYTFGAPYYRQDYSKSALITSRCLASGHSPNAPLLASGGAALKAPMADVNTGVTLQMVHIGTALSPSPVKATEGSFTLGLGLGETLHGN